MALTAQMELLDISAYAPGQTLFNKFAVDIQPTEIKIQWDNYNRTILLDALKTRADFRPPIVYCLRAQQLDSVVDPQTKVVKTHFMPAELVNWLGVTLPTKESIQDYSIRTRLYPSFMICVPAIDAQFSECHYRLMYNGASLFEPITANIPMVDREFHHDIVCYDKNSLNTSGADSFDLRLEKLPTLEITGPDNIAAGGSAEYTITSKFDGADFARPIHVDLDTNDGMISKWRTVLTGTDTFTFTASDLPTGLVVSLKAGYRFWPSLTEKLVTIS